LEVAVRSALKRIAQRIMGRISVPLEIESMRQTLNAMETRLAWVEKRLYNRRFAAVEEMADYLTGARVEGDYCEFGVYRGDTFGYVCEITALSAALRHMQCFAFDSFRGLPRPRDVDALNGYTSNFHEGEFACSKKEFEKNLRSLGVDMTRVRIIEGWFQDTLSDQTAAALGIEKIAAAWIDGDLYESTVPVLQFLSHRLSVGSIILFDDWRVFRNLPDRGEQRACTEWLKENPQISLRELFSFGHHGVAFTVATC